MQTGALFGDNEATLLVRLLAWAKYKPTFEEVKAPMSPVPETLGRRIFQLRERRGWWQKELARRAKISPTFLSEIENDKRNVSADVLLRIANALNASLDYLLRGEEPPLEREPLLVPPELAQAAEDERWSYDETSRLLKARKLVLARRGAIDQTAANALTKEDWIQFHHRLFDDELASS